MTAHDIWTIEEVAGYLRVSERTVYDWVHRGEIPCGKIGSTWRFKRSEIEAWVDARLSKPPEEPAFEGVAAVLPVDRVLLTDLAAKEDVIEALLGCLERTQEVTDPGALRREMLAREDIMSTGMGHGLGVPHVRIASVKGLVMAVAVNRRDIAGYDSLDGAPVRVVCMMAAREDQHTAYLRALAAVSGVMRDDAKRAALLTAETADQARQILCAEAPGASIG